MPAPVQELPNDDPTPSEEDINSRWIAPSDYMPVDKEVFASNDFKDLPIASKGDDLEIIKKDVIDHPERWNDYSVEKYANIIQHGLDKATEAQKLKQQELINIKLDKIKKELEFEHTSKVQSHNLKMFAAKVAITVLSAIVVIGLSAFVYVVVKNAVMDEASFWSGLFSVLAEVFRLVF